MNITIFTKETETCNPINLSEINKIIPSTASTEKKEFTSDVIEWRWRFLNIGGNKMIEISYLDNLIRKYVDEYGNLITCIIDDTWDEYVEKVLYAYVRK